MSIIPTLRCRRMRASLAFYTEVLDFRHVGGDGRVDDPAFVVLARGRDRLILSSHAGDGAFGQAVVVTTPVHAAPVDQTWGTREVYVDDPDGHTLRFVQGWEAEGDDVRGP
jgi:catechol 2,3-dioxygenase-like lactoylglutathione lyase family enzyme